MSRKNSDRTFWLYAERVGPCLEWQGPRNKRGYGWFNINYRSVQAHRYAWMLMRGPIPDGLSVCHTCDNPPCVDVLHMFLGTAKDNARDAIAKGRVTHSWPGVLNGHARINEDIVREIRSLAEQGVPRRVIGLQFGIAKGHVTNIVNRTKWAHVA